MTKFKTQEFQLINCSHHMLTMLLDDKLFLAPIKTNPEKVLDVGTGTGIWAMYDFFSWFPYLFGLQQWNNSTFSIYSDFADEYPSTTVIGTDLSPIQPSWVPPNLKFEVDDAQLDWTYAEADFDFVHIRCLMGSIENWPRLFRQAYRWAWLSFLESCELYTNNPSSFANVLELHQIKRLHRGSRDGHPVHLRWRHCRSRTHNVRMVTNIHRRGWKDGSDLQNPQSIQKAYPRGWVCWCRGKEVQNACWGVDGRSKMERDRGVQPPIPDDRARRDGVIHTEKRSRCRSFPLDNADANRSGVAVANAHSGIISRSKLWLERCEKRYGIRRITAIMRCKWCPFFPRGSLLILTTVGYQHCSVWTQAPGNFATIAPMSIFAPISLSFSSVTPYIFI